jgi:hypothetical protein
MKRREYFIINKEVILPLFKLIGVVSTSIIAVLFILTSFHFKSLMDVLYLFLTCFILGNLIAFSLTLMYFSLNYVPYRDQMELFESLSDDLKDEFKIGLYYPPFKYKYDLTDVHILCIYEIYLFGIRYDKAEKTIGITVLNNLEGIDFANATDYADKKYKNDSICLSGCGLRKVIKYKDWKNSGSNELRKVFMELLKISDEESLEVVIPKSPEE